NSLRVFSGSIAFTSRRKERVARPASRTSEESILAKTVPRPNEVVFRGPRRGGAPAPPADDAAVTLNRPDGDITGRGSADRDAFANSTSLAEDTRFAGTMKGERGFPRSRRCRSSAGPN